MKLYEYIIRVKDQASAQFDKLSKAAGVANTQADNVKKTLERTGQSSDMLGQSLNSLKKTLISVFTITAIYSFGANIVKAGAAMEQTKISFEVMLGSAERATAMLSEITEFAAKTPFSQVDLQNNAKLLLNFGISADKIIPSLQMIGDIAGGDAQRMNSLTLAFAQVQSAGKLTGQDLLQMINAGFNPLNELSKTTGKSMAVLKDEMSKGGISAQMVEQAFKSVTSEGGIFFGMMDKQSKTVLGKFSSVMDDLNMKFQAFYVKYLEPVIHAILDFAAAVLKGEEYTRKWIIAIGIIGVAILSYKVGVLLAAAATAVWQGVVFVANLATTLWTKGVVGLNAALAANPVGLVVMLIVGLIAAVIWAYNKFDWFRGAVWGLWDAFKEVFTSIGDIAKNVFGGMWDVISGIWEGNGAKIKAGALAMGKGLLAANPAGFAMQYGENVVNAAKKGYAKGLAKGPISVGDLFNPGFAGSTVNEDTVTDGTGNGNGNGNGSAISGITGGGSRAVSVTVNLGKMLENITINAPVDEAFDDIEDRMKELLARIINGGLYSATQ